jgi:hypothetical protein
MTVHRIIEPLPDGISTPSDIEAFARRMAPLVVQEMAQTFGAVRNGENEVLSWIAHAWQLDGTFISLGVRPRARDAMLYLNTHGLERPLEQKSSQKWLWLFFVAISIGVGVFLCSFWAATGVLVAERTAEQSTLQIGMPGSRPPCARQQHRLSLQMRSTVGLL